MKTLDIIKPYNDDVLEYNETVGRYQLTLQYLKGIVERLPYRNDGVAKQRIKENSQHIYQYIITHSNTVNRSVISFVLNRTEQGRKFLIEVLETQMLADIDYAYNDLTRRPIINGSTGQEGNRDVYRQNQISIETENAIDDSINYLGFNICVLTPFSWQLFNFVREHEGD